MRVPNLTEIQSCRVCQEENLESMIHLGEHALHRCIPKGDKTPEYTAPLELVYCPNCHLPQLRHTVPPDILFREYFYFSGMNETMRVALAEVTQRAEEMVKLQEGDVVMDIGSNDSVLLRSYRTKGLYKVGFEPARNLMPVAQIDDGEIINDYFNADKYIGKKSPKVITAIACFYDLPDPVGFVRDVEDILDRDGIFICQMNYFPLILWQNAYDNIGFEHLAFYGVTHMEQVLRHTGLKPFRVEFNTVNGGSFRLYASKEQRPDDTIKAAIQLENAMRINSRSVYEGFVERIMLLRRKLRALCLNLKHEGKEIWLYGASTRSSTTLQFCELDSNIITAAADRNPSKWGTLTSGTHIQIVSEGQMRKLHPDYLLIGPWQFLPEFMTREAEYLSKGGHFILPMPDVKVVP